MNGDPQFGLEGIVDKGDAFELQLPTQVEIAVNGTYKSAVNSYVETELTWLTGTPRSMIVSRTDLAGSTPSRFSNGACLRLPPGKYSFVGRVRSNPGGQIAAPNIVTAAATLYDDLHHSGVVGVASAVGSNNGFVTLSHKAERHIFATLRVYVKPAVAERVYATLKMLDVASGVVVAAPRVIQAGQSPYPLEAQAAPIYVQPGRLYRFQYDLIYPGQAETTVAISISG